MRINFSWGDDTAIIASIESNDARIEVGYMSGKVANEVIDMLGMSGQIARVYTRSAFVHELWLRNCVSIVFAECDFKWSEGSWCMDGKREAVTYEQIKFVWKDDGRGVRAVYRLSEPIVFRELHGQKKETKYVVADFAYTFDNGPETMVFPSDDEGEVLDWMDLWCCYREAVIDNSAIEEFCKSIKKEG